MQKIKPYYPHLLALLGFVIAALLYFYPVLKGDVIYQSDIVQYTGMQKNKTTLEPKQMLNRIGQMLLLVVCQPISWVQSTRIIM